MSVRFFNRKTLSFPCILRVELSSRDVPPPPPRDFSPEVGLYPLLRPLFQFPPLANVASTNSRPSPPDDTFEPSAPRLTSSRFFFELPRRVLAAVLQCGGSSSRKAPFPVRVYASLGPFFSGETSSSRFYYALFLPCRSPPARGPSFPF